MQTQKFPNDPHIRIRACGNKNWWNLIGTTFTASGMRLVKKIGIVWTNFAAVAMETKKEGFKIILDSFKHMIFLQGFIKFDQGISEKSSRLNNKKWCKNNKSPNFVWGLNNKKRCKNNKSPNYVLKLLIKSPKQCLESNCFCSVSYYY
jgi:hypothetical protein